MAEAQNPPPNGPSAAPLKSSESQPAPAVNTAPAVESEEKVFAAIGYFAFLFVIPLIVKPNSNFCKFHARQSMVLFLTTIVVLVVLAGVPWFGSLLTTALFAVYVLAIYRSYIGEMWQIPAVGKLAEKLDLEKLYGKAGVALSSVSTLKEKAQDLASAASDTAKALGAQGKPQSGQPSPPASPSVPQPAPPATPAPPPKS